MRILIVGGFLGSGKTTLVHEIAQVLLKCGTGTLAIIENEAGEVGLDAQLLAQPQISVTEIYGGCLCCQYSGRLLPAVVSIQETLAPEWLIIELTGLALLPGVLETFHHASQAYCVTSVCVIDASRWDKLRLATGDMLFEQARGAQVAVLNKTDVNSAASAIEMELREHLPHTVVLKSVLRQGLPEGLLDLILAE